MKEIILRIIKKKPKTKEELMKSKRILAKKHGIGVLPNSLIFRGYLELLEQGKTKRDEKLERLLRKREVRTLSGVAPVAVLTKPWPCPGRCAYCPSEKDVPQSYLSNEPAVMRAIRNKYDPYSQAYMRLAALEANGHRPEKIELIVIGGTWSFLPKKYKYWYIANLFAAANDYQLKKREKKPQTKIKKNLSLVELKKILAREQERNEKAKYKIIGLTLETRPDYINNDELAEMRELGATRIEIGVQAIDDKILAKNKRGHRVAEIISATRLLKDYGFKVTYHIMPGLPGSSAKKDLVMFKKLFSDEAFCPDQIKFYPTVVTQGSLLYRWWEKGQYKPYSKRVLEKLIIDCKKIVPRYVRIIRLIRDIPKESIVAGNTITNLRQQVAARGVKCNCIRCRECREKKIRARDLKLNIKKYKASGGVEYFISFDSRDGKVLYGFLRLRLVKKSKVSEFDILKNSGLVRELHVYGELVPVGEKKKTQHAGLGKRLLKKAEEISAKEGFCEIAVISGIGARGYYKDLGYKLKNTYLIKYLCKK